MKKEKILTIITPTYNRAEKLSVLYESLCEQTCEAFEWLIVDDGSEDKTKEVVQGWIDSKKISISYLYKCNGGKHTALNVGIKNIETPLTFIVDSDDYLLPEAVNQIVSDYSDISRDDICGIAYLRQSKDGHYLTNKLVPENGLIESFCDCRYGRGIKGDMAEVWMTKCLKEYPFPEFENEKFVSEDVVWIQMSQKYKLIFYNIPIYISDYLEGGLTKTRRDQNAKSPNGGMFRGIVQLRAKLPLYYKIRAILYYQIYGSIAGYSYKDLFAKSEKKLLFLIMFIPSIFLRKRYS
ncbi:glycosyltransferase family 2 protein [Butyrivibrio sp. AC2005]|uniref:glycosyltransferase family 2 protein n=1 Tax=Butyrivibrio sp. AC2005 TaxID=1280672 RepID=UPI00040F90C6|nr:glycosyltransferase family 2 protein [Butyrivibrio sp. AC2005]